MENLTERVQRFGGHQAYPGEGPLVRVPAAKVLEFCRAELRLGNDIDFAECLYLFNGGGIQPSMELSRDRADSSDIESFLTFVSKAAEIANRRARPKGAEAFFEIGLVER